jgi:class 3 adenylate cyclase/tetratricopeptide (TPR) repeat protein
MVTCSSCGQENPEGFKFCGACGASLEAVPAPRETRKTVTVVFSDVTGSTALGERLDPESLRRVMGRYFDEMKAVVNSHEGTVEKFIGDAVMAVFGIPIVHEDDALRAVRAAAEMRERLGALNEELERDWGVRIEVRTGVNTGEVVAGDGSGGQRFATGDAVNVAKRFEEAAPPGEILLGETTWRLVRDAVEVESVAELELKGKDSPVGAFRLVSIEPGAAGRARRLDSPMVGRAREQSLLEQAYERAAEERACHLFTILGAAGVGKSRLIEEFLDWLGDRATVVRGRCLPYGVGITFWPLHEVLRGLVSEESISAVAASLAGNENADLIAERVGAVVGLADAPGSTEEAFWATRKLLESRATDRPLVVVFDDLQWGEPTFLDLVEHVADWSRDAPIVLVCLARPELLDERQGWGGGKLNATSVLLERLTDEESEELVSNLLGRAGLASSVSARITEAAEGNPLFVEEMLGMLIDDGLLERSNGNWVPTGDIDSVAVPPTIQALLSARLDRLAADERGVIERASVEGKLFHRGGIAALSPSGKRDSVGAHLQSLVRKELVRPDTPELPGEDAFRFRHLLIRDAAYEGMPKELRADLHERFAGWLERAAAERRAEYEEILGYHLEQAYRYRTELAPVDAAGTALAERAAGWLASAGLRAHARSDPSSAAKLLGRALPLLRDDAPLRLEILPSLAESLFETGRFDETRDLIMMAKATALDVGDSRLETRIAIIETLFLAQTDPEYAMEQMATVAERAIPILEAAGDDEGLAEAYALLAKNLAWSGRFASSDDAFEKAIEFAQRANDPQLAIEARGWIALNCAYGGIDVEEGLARIDGLLEASEGVKSSALAARGALLALQGRFDEARAEVTTGRNMALELGATLTWAGTAAVDANIELLRGNPQAAEDVLRAAVDELRRVGETGYVSTLYGLLAHALYNQGLYDDAYDMTEECRLAAAEADIDPQVQWRRVRAKVIAQRGESAEAEEFAREAVARVSGTEMLDLHAGALLDLAEILRRGDRVDESRDHAAQALELLEQRGNLVVAERARALAA